MNISFELTDMHPAPISTRDRGIVAIEHGHRLVAFDVEVFADGVISAVCECTGGLSTADARKLFATQLERGTAVFAKGAVMGRRISKNLISGDYCWNR